MENLKLLTYSQLTNKHCDLSYQHYCGNVDNSSINDLYYIYFEIKKTLQKSVYFLINSLRPFFLLLLITELFIRAKKPCFLALFLLFG